MKDIAYLTIMCLVIFSCSSMPDWSDPQDTIPPGKVSNVEVENLHGGVRVTYSLPNDNDLLGVKAIYKFHENDIDREVFSSSFRDTIEIHGFPNTNERIISLVCIDKSRNESEPVNIIINPLTPAVEIIRQTLNVIPTFGGLYVSWENIDRADIGVTLSYDDGTGTGKMEEYYTYYSNLYDGKFAFRGFDDSERKFSIKIRDRWNNFSESLDTIMKPLFEEEIVPYNPNTGVRRWKLFGIEDNTGYANWMGDMIKAGSFQNAIDGITMHRNTWWQSNAASGNHLANWVDDILPKSEEDVDVWPYSFTLNLDVPSSLSRHILWMRGRNPGEAMLLGTHRYYQQGAPKKYEIWGLEESKSIKTPSDFNNDKMASLRYWTEYEEIGGIATWKDDWTYLGTNYCLPPSGATSTPMLTVDDIIYADEGFELEINPDVSDKKFKYVRFVFYELWHTTPYFDIGEIKFYGAY